MNSPVPPAREAPPGAAGGGRAAPWWVRGLGGRAGRTTDDVAADAAPTDGARTDGARTDGARTDGARTGGARTDGAPTDGAPTDGARTDGAPTDGAPTNGPATDGAESDGADPDGGPTLPVAFGPAGAEQPAGAVRLAGPQRPAGSQQPSRPQQPIGTPWSPADDRTTALRSERPRLTRRRSGRILGGVAGGLADHLEVDVRWVRVAFVVLTFLGWAGVLTYGLFWVFVRQEVGGPHRTVGRAERLHAAGLLALGIGLSLVAVTSDSAVFGWIAGPLGLAAVGAAVVWREADESQRRQWAHDARARVVGGRAALLRTLLGAGLVITGLAVFLLGNLDLGQVRFGILAAVATLLGVTVLTIPWWVRLVRDVSEQRQARAVEAERAEVAAHLHDSVLQSLALIQRQAGDPREVQRIARGQERELRSWLYGPGGRARGGGGPADTAETTLAAAITRVAAEVEDTYAVTVGPVLVGDVELDPDLRALVLAAREAMVNAAKHSGTAEVDVYVEVEPASADDPGQVEVFVRDRGRGFDQNGVDGDRHGLADSIHERMRRHGGTVRIRTGTGEGTEVRLSMPLTQGETS